MTKEGRTPRRAWLLLLALSLAATDGARVSAHEVETNRLTLVLRDERHVSITYYIDYPTALHRALAPASPFNEFIVAHSAMPLPELRKALSRAEALLETQTRITATSSPLRIGSWKWPEAARAQTLLREVAMAGLVDPTGHAHMPPLEVRAEGLASRAITALDVSLPEALGNVIVVSYRPRQTAIGAGVKSVRVTF